MNAPPQLLALVDQHGIVQTFTTMAQLSRHVNAIPPHVAERCDVVRYQLATVAGADGEPRAATMPAAEVPRLLLSFSQAELELLKRLCGVLGLPEADVIRFALYRLAEQAFTEPPKRKRTRALAAPAPTLPEPKP